MNRVSRVFLLLSCLLWGGHPGPAAAADSSVRISRAEGICELEAQDALLKVVLKGLRKECGVTVSGLEGRKGERISIPPTNGTPEQVVKVLLDRLEETNYLLQFAEEELVKASVLSSAKSDATAPRPPAGRQPERPSGPPDASGPGAPSAPAPPPFRDRATVVAVRGVIAGSQAEDVGLKEGDIIVQYGGDRVESTSQLIARVKETSPDEDVEMLVLREGRPMSFMVKGGQIGVQIHTVLIPEEALKEALPEEPGEEQPPKSPAVRTF